MAVNPDVFVSSVLDAITRAGALEQWADVRIADEKDYLRWPAVDLAGGGSRAYVVRERSTGAEHPLTVMIARRGFGQIGSTLRTTAQAKTDPMLGLEREYADELYAAYRHRNARNVEAEDTDAVVQIALFGSIRYEDLPEEVAAA